jgi:hypothetical protein
MYRSAGRVPYSRRTGRSGCPVLPVSVVRSTPVGVGGGVPWYSNTCPLSRGDSIDGYRPLGWGCIPVPVDREGHPHLEYYKPITLPPTQVDSGPRVHH